MIDTPFGPPISEVPLPDAPLALVVGQVRFPLDPSLDDEATIRTVHDELRSEYPVLRQDYEMRVDFTPEGPKPSTQPVWRLMAIDESTWTVSLSRTFVSVSAKRYTSRADFVARLRRVFDVLAALLSPPLADRLGIRYVCRIEEPSLLQGLARLLRPEVAGTFTTELGAGSVRQRELVDALYRQSDGTLLQARWGLLEAAVTYDLTIPPSPNAAFILDLDVSTSVAQPFSPGELAELSRHFAERQYRFFRWAVTDDFLHAFGGGGHR